MWGKSPIVLLSLCGAALVLAGCSAGDQSSSSGGQDGSSAAQAEDQSGNQGRVAVSETAWLTVSEDGFAYTTFIDANGRYRDYRDGDLVLAGEWSESAENKLCFSPDDGVGECWTFGASEADGRMRIIGESGREIVAKRVTYSPLGETMDDSQTAGS